MKNPKLLRAELFPVLAHTIQYMKVSCCYLCLHACQHMCQWVSMQRLPIRWLTNAQRISLVKTKISKLPTNLFQAHLQSRAQPVQGYVVKAANGISRQKIVMT